MQLFEQFLDTGSDTKIMCLSFGSFRVVRLRRFALKCYMHKISPPSCVTHTMEWGLMDRHNIMSLLLPSFLAMINRVDLFRSNRGWMDIIIDHVALAKQGDNALGSVCLCTVSYLNRWPLPVQGVRLCVCNQWTCVDNIVDAVDQLLIRHITSHLH